MKVIHLTGLFALLFVCCLAGSAPITIVTEHGPVVGEIDDIARSFKGIPYAAPPVGENRWEDPIPPTPWTNVFNATQFRPACPQNCELPPKTCPDEIDEDCLHLNVYVPSKLRQLQPVMVYFHGGRFEQGTAGNILYDGKFVSNMSEVVTVIANYRLGALGGLTLGPIKGNFAVKDQRLALTWVQNNIKNFGGDPTKVTIFGQSAGGASIAAHLITEKSKGLFHKAIVQSNPYQLPFKTRETYKPIAEALAKELGCPDFSVSCLKSKPFQEVVAAQKVAEDTSVDITQPFQSILPWTPLVSDDDIKYQPLEALQKGLYHKVPIMQGLTTEEAHLFVNLGVKTPLGDFPYYAILSVLFGNLASEVGTRYPSNGVDNRIPMNAIGDDLLFYCPMINSTIEMSDGDPPIYIYHYNHSLSFDGWGPRYPFCQGHPCHGGELPILFNTAKAAGFPASPDEVILGRVMAAYWTNFARTGNPNQGNMSVPVKWVPYTNKSRFGLVFNTKETTIVKDFRVEECAFWNKNGFRWGW